MKYEVGKVYDIGGEKRKVLRVKPELVTTSDLAYEEPKDLAVEAAKDAKTEAEQILQDSTVSEEMSNSELVAAITQ